MWHRDTLPTFLILSIYFPHDGLGQEPLPHLTDVETITCSKQTAKGQRKLRQQETSFLFRCVLHTQEAVHQEVSSTKLEVEVRLGPWAELPSELFESQRGIQLIFFPEDSASSWYRALLG
jgi:hypothetical protein